LRRIWLDCSGVSRVDARAAPKREAGNMDLYEGLVLGFLALGVLALMGIFTRLGPIVRSLETSAGQPAAEPLPEDVGAGAAAPQSRTEPEEHAFAEASPVSAGKWEPEPFAVQEPEPVVAQEPQPEPGPEPVVAEEPEPEREPEPVVAQEPEPEPVVAQEPEPEPVVAQEPEPEPVMAQEPTQVASEEPDELGTEEEPEPEEKPFQRDGRWWFRRDDELLVYDESSGEWLPGDAAAGSFLLGSDNASATADATGPGLSRVTAGVATREREETDESGERFTEGEVTEQLSGPSFWKCSTCGAVNGSTATSCRMCFAARP
jgi:hypothetical protein